ncbi:Protein kinase-like protein [Metarhizium robertsii ARSEF 23]|uniref:non-specific serine/threonine protein kinase n=2 Tax=Opisthokonta TaxID=33154 RepID=E9FA38_METRA|nr:Protein kinase-like protein [Metarhizium robertsii ARSEF 23]EFY95436.1 Protein kinase-like protein [Metarhizium robertsii ARSEF 23]
MSESDRVRLKLIQDHPISNGLDAFRTSFRQITDSDIDQLTTEDVQDVLFSLLSSLRILPVSRLLRSKTLARRTVRDDILRLISIATADDFDFDRIKPLLKAALADSPRDELIWDLVAKAALESTPPPRPIVSSFQQTPWRHNTSSFANSSEYRRDVDRVLKEELGPLHVGLSSFQDTFFGSIEGLETAAEAVFQSCTSGNDPLFQDGWAGWPNDANQDDVLQWFTDVTTKLMALAQSHNPPQTCRRPVAQPSKPILGSTGERKMDIGFVSDPEAGKGSRCHWSQILVPGELKSNPSADTAAKAWLDLGRYAREVLAAQDTRRFVLGFTLCGSLMRIWEFDRLGGIASEQFDINKQGQLFVSTILGFLWMSERDLGFDPTIITRGDERYIEIERDGQKQHIILKKVLRRARCIAGRATTCWLAYADQEPQTALVVKDSWQYTERAEEGELLQEATERGVINVARYYYHTTVRVGDKDDDVLANIRKGLDLSEAVNTRFRRSNKSTSNASATSTPGQSHSSSIGVKRPSSETSLPLPPRKRSISTSPTKAGMEQLSNRVHRRIILCDYGVPLYEASSRIALLAAMERYIEGHESLLKAGFLHRDISINNLMIDEDKDKAFLIDLDLAIRVPRVDATGAKEKTGTRAFMAIGALLGDEHSFMHDLESFFWVLFWICIHYDGPGKDIGSTEFDSWNYEKDSRLVQLKVGTIGDESIFLKIAGDNFTPFYRPLIPLMNKVRKKIFPHGETWRTENFGMYRMIKEILADGQSDPDVL